MKTFRLSYILVFVIFVLFGKVSFPIGGKDYILDSLLQNAKMYLSVSPGLAIDYAEQVAKVSTSPGTSGFLADAFGVLGEAYYFQGDYKIALKYYLKELEVRQQHVDNKTLMVAYFNIGVLYKALENSRKSVDYYKLGLDLAEGLKDKEVMLKFYEALADAYQDQGNYKSAYTYHKLFVSLKDAEREKEISVIKIKYEKAKVQKELELQKKETALRQAKEKEQELIEDVQQKEDKIEELHVETKEKEQEIKIKEEVIQEKQEKVEQQQKTILVAIIGFLIILAYSILLFRQYKQKNKAYQLLALQNEEIQQQKEEIEAQRDEIEAQRDRIAHQNKDITDSISYGSKIQKVILSRTNILKRTLDDFFILFMPRSIVSGDFYWFSFEQGKLIVAAVDCTGHGVPGAFMSMLGTAFLNEIVIKEGIFMPEQILNKLRDNVISTLKQDNEGEENKDGMDIALITLDVQQNTLYFSGANNPLYLLRGDKLEVIKGSRMPIGIYRKMQSYTQHEISVRKGDLLYIFSDGYVDQFGGAENKKLKQKAFQQQLLNIRHKPMDGQRVELERFIERWKGYNDQVDDILVIGLKI